MTKKLLLLISFVLIILNTNSFARTNRALLIGVSNYPSLNKNLQLS